MARARWTLKVASEVHVNGSNNNTDPLARAEGLKPIVTEKKSTYTTSCLQCRREGTFTSAITQLQEQS